MKNDPMKKVFILTVSVDKYGTTLVHLFRKNMRPRCDYFHKMPKYIQKFLMTNYNMPSWTRSNNIATFYTWKFDN